MESNLKRLDRLYSELVASDFTEFKTIAGMKNITGVYIVIPLNKKLFTSEAQINFMLGLEQI